MPSSPAAHPSDGLITAGRLWAALVLASVFAAVAAIPISPADFWWHLKAGETLLDGGGLLTADPWSFTASGRPYIHQEWLAGAAFAAVARLGGLEWVVVGAALLFAAAFGLVLLRCHDAAGNLRIAAAATAAGFLITIENLALRPQVFTVLLLALTLLLVRRYADGRLPGRWLAVLPPLTALWANLHGGFVLGLAAQGAVAAGLLAEKRLLLRGADLTPPASRGRPAPDGAGGDFLAAPRREEAGMRSVSGIPLLVTGFASAAAACLNPWGTGIYWYVWSFIADPSHRTFIVEWAATDLSFLSGRLFFAYLAALLGVLVLSRRVPRPHDVLLLLGFGVLALSSVRNVLWFGMVAAPVLAAGLRALTYSPAPSGSPYREREGVKALAYLALVSVFVMPLAMTPWARARLPLPEARRALITGDTPVAAAQALAALPPGRRTFHDMQYGSYLIWAVAPHQPVFIDTRVELYPFEQWTDYGTIAAGLKAEELLARYRIDTLLLDRQRQAGLLAALEGDPAWEQVYADQTAVLYRRKEAAP